MDRERRDSDSLESTSVPLVLKNMDSLDLSSMNLDQYSIEMSLNSIISKTYQENITCLNLSSNQLENLPKCLEQLCNLRTLDISDNHLTHLELISKLKNLSTLIASNNEFNEKSFNEDFGLTLTNTLRVFSLSGNRFETIPSQIYGLIQLRSLYLGGNKIKEIGKDIKKLINLRILYLGGNQLTEIPTEVGLLVHLQALSLCENQIAFLPTSIAKLRNLKSLSLHKNLLTTLPQEIVKLRGLVELSLRDNPLVVRFIREMLNDPPSLLELAGRVIKTHKIAFSEKHVPKQLSEYLSTAQCCVNPKCKGVYFDARVEHVKFVDFCGIYRLPLLQYLCSPSCSKQNPNIFSSSSEDEMNEVPVSKLRRVLLG